MILDANSCNKVYIYINRQIFVLSTSVGLSHARPNYTSQCHLLPSSHIIPYFRMTSISKPYEPSLRFAHGAAAVGGRCYLRGGRVQDFSASGRRKLLSTVEIFDPHLGTWEEHLTTGVPPPGLYHGACTSQLGSVYWFGGYNGSLCYNSLHRLDTTTLEWREIQPQNQADGPMRKKGSGMVSFLQDRLAVFGGYGIGYGIHTGPTQPGAMFTYDFHSTGGWGWSSELHVFTITESMSALCVHF